MILKAISAVLILFLAACASLQQIRLAPRSSPVPPVALLNEIPANAIDLGEVSETACVRNLLDPRPGWELVLDKLKRAAAQKGANSVGELRYEDKPLLCPMGIKVSARAINAAPKSLAEPSASPPPQNCNSDTLSLSDFMACKIAAMPHSL